jgi:predicted nucleic acid-binding protein
MVGLIIDACVSPKWVVAEAFSDEAALLINGGFELHAPSHWMAEANNVLWDYWHRRKLMTRDDLDEAAALLREVTVRETPIRGLLPAAIRIAAELEITVYDGLYLSLAEGLRLPLVTADRKLMNAAEAHPSFRQLILWVGEVPNLSDAA